MSPIGTCCGTVRSSHVAPRSIERKRCELATSIHTTPPEGAVSVAFVGCGMSVPLGAAVGAAVVGETDGAGIAVVAGGLGDGVDEDAGGVHAATKSASTRAAVFTRSKSARSRCQRLLRRPRASDRPALD